MTRRCPKCHQNLAPLGRGVYQCPGCGGTFVPRGVELDPDDDARGAATGAARDEDGGLCPIDQAIMVRATIDLTPDGERKLYLERCGSCRGVWFDAGEWTHLAERQLIEHLNDFWSAEWRARQLRVRNEEGYRRRVEETFGPELYTVLQTVAAKLRGHERRSQALAFLREASED